MKQFGQDIWIIDGGTTSVLGFRYPTRAAIIRLQNGELLVWSPVSLDEAMRTRVDEIGPVRHVVAPNSLHHLYVGDWLEAWPDAVLHAAPGLARKRPDLPITHELAQTPPEAWQGQVDIAPIHGNAITTEIVLFHQASRTVLFTDLLQQYPDGWFSGWRAMIAKLDLMVEPKPTVPRKFRLAFTDKAAARQSLEKVFNWPAEKVLMAHGTPVEADGKAFIAEAFAWMG